MGACLDDHVELRKIDPAYRVHYADRTKLDILYDIEQMREQLDDVEPGSGGRFLEWLGKARLTLDKGVAGFIENVRWLISWVHCDVR